MVAAVVVGHTVDGGEAKNRLGGEMELDEAQEAAEGEGGAVAASSLLARMRRCGAGATASARAFAAIVRA